jgi:hypothetical protein
VVEQPLGDQNFMILAITPEELAKSMEEAAGIKMQALLEGLHRFNHNDTDPPWRSRRSNS